MKNKNMRESKFKWKELVKEQINYNKKRISTFSNDLKKTERQGMIKYYAENMYIEKKPKKKIIVL